MEKNQLTVYLFKVNPQNRILEDIIDTKVKSKKNKPEVVSLSNSTKGSFYQVHALNQPSAIRTFENSSI